MLKETLAVNAEGILIAFLTYLIFSKFSLREKIRNGKPHQRILAILVYCVFWGSVFYLIEAQNRNDQQANGQELSWYLIFWVVFANWQFYLMPVYQDYKARMSR